jgi:iron complex outermembrane receptor protein
MMMTPVRVNITHCALTLLMAIAMLGPWTPKLSAQEPLDSVIPLDSIVVTVLRANNGLGRTPYAVSVRSGRDLQLGNTSFSLDEALQGIPGVQIQNRYNYSVGERISIRGFGARAQFGARGIKIFVDGIPATMADGQSTLDHLDIGTLGRVEILRGPSAAMYGNAGGGVLSFQTKASPNVPVREEVTTTFGDNGLMRFQSTTSGSKNGTTYLLNISHLTYDGFRTVGDSTDFAVERSDSSTYGQATRLNVNGQLGLQAGAGRLLFTANFMDLAAESAGGLNRTAMYVDESLNARGGGFGNVARNARKDVYQGQLGARWTGPVGNLNAEFVGWGLFRRMDNPIPPRIIDLSRNAFGIRTVISRQDSRDPGEVTWAAGFDLDFQRDDRVEHANSGGMRGTLTKDQFETVTAAGFFLQASAPLGDRASLLGGVRYDRFDFGVEDRLGDGTGDRVMDAVSPTVGLVVQASPTLSVFSNFASSLATPTTTELGNTIDGTGGFNPDLDPQTGNTGEIGMRGQASSRFGYEASVFLSKLKNELVAFQDSTQDGRDFFRNAGKSTHKGFEASFRAVLPEGVYGQIAYTFVDAKFDEFVVDGEDLAGNFIPGLAKHRFEGLVRVSRGTWFGEIRGDHVGKIYTNDANSPNTAAKNYTLWDVRTGLTGQRVGNIQVAPFVSLTNIFNEVYSAAVAVNAFGSRYFEPGPRRAFSAGLTATF